MVTLLGFVWIVANVFLIELAVPDMVGPVSWQLPVLFLPEWRIDQNSGSWVDLLQLRSWHVDVSVRRRPIRIGSNGTQVFHPRQC